MKGKKSCPKCNSINGCRASRCSNKECGYTFYETETDKTKVDWKSLQKGDYIKSLIGYGPEYNPKDGGETQFLGHYGRFTVIGVDAQGILATDSDGGFCHIYMGEEKPSKVIGILKPHKIIRAKKRKDKTAQ